jgi:DNA polymerase-3 subunit epsilon
VSLHQIFTLTRPLIVVDTETTGVDTRTDRIIELGFEMWTSEGLTREYRTLVNPGIPIENAHTGHGITDDAFKKCRTCDLPLGPACCTEPRGWPSFKQLAENLARGFTNVDFAGKNVRFDLRILTSEFARAGVPWTIGNARIIDNDRLEAWLNKRSLSHLYRKYTGEKHDGAHGAMADVKASRVVLQHQMDSVTQNEDEATSLPRDLDALHALQFPGMIDLDGKFQFVDGVPCFSQWGKHAGKPMKVADVGYWDWLIKSDFSIEVKRIAELAKLGQFPVAR